MSGKLRKSAQARVPRQRREWEYTNEGAATIDFVIEPEGDIVKMPPGVTYRVVAEGPATGDLQTKVKSDHVTVYGWPGSSLTVTCDGEEIA
jgi:hypothetical protein